MDDIDALVAQIEGMAPSSVSGSASRRRARRRRRAMREEMAEEQRTSRATDAAPTKPETSSESVSQSEAATAPAPLSVAPPPPPPKEKYEPLHPSRELEELRREESEEAAAGAGGPSLAGEEQLESSTAEAEAEDREELSPEEARLVRFLSVDEVLEGGLRTWVENDAAAGVRRARVSLQSLLPDAVLKHLFRFLDAPSLAACCRVSRRWYRMGSDERLWRRQCKIALLVQADQDVVQYIREQARRRRSWKAVFPDIPRVRSGLYVMRMSYFRKPYRDMWHDPPPVLVCVYYRILAFRPNGTVLYLNHPGALKDAVHALRAAPHLRPSSVHVGRYRLHGSRVRAEVPVSHGVVLRWTLQLTTGKQGWSEAEGLPGGSLDVMSVQLHDLPRSQREWTQHVPGSDPGDVVLRDDDEDEDDGEEGEDGSVTPSEPGVGAILRRRKHWGWADSWMTPESRWEDSGTPMTEMQDESFDFVRLRV